MKHWAYFIGVCFVLFCSVLHWNIYFKQRVYSILKNTFVSYLILKRKLISTLTSTVLKDSLCCSFHQNSGKMMGEQGQLGKLFQLMFYVIFMLNTRKSKFKKLMGSIAVFHFMIIWFGLNVGVYYSVNYSAEINNARFNVSIQETVLVWFFHLFYLVSSKNFVLIFSLGRKGIWGNSEKSQKIMK